MFITQGQMLAMIFAFLFPAICSAALFVYLHRKMHTDHTGLGGAAAYGFAGYVWQEILYMLCLVLMTKFSWFENLNENLYLLVSLLYALLSAFFVAFGMYWIIRKIKAKTEEADKYLWRVCAVGIGFSAGNIGWNLLVPYCSSLYYAARINTGIFYGSQSLAESVASSSVSGMMLDGLKGAWMLLIYVALALIMGIYMKEKPKASAVIGVLVPFGISIVNALVGYFGCGTTVAQVAIQIFLVLLAAAGSYLVWIRLLRKKS